MNSLSSSVPQTGLAGLTQHWRSDIVSGFLVFLICLPLCLGMANASGFPPMAGVTSAIIGVSRINGTHVTVTGPASGLIVLILTAEKQAANLLPNRQDRCRHLGFSGQRFGDFFQFHRFEDRSYRGAAG